MHHAYSCYVCLSLLHRKRGKSSVHGRRLPCLRMYTSGGANLKESRNRACGGSMCVVYSDWWDAGGLRVLFYRSMLLFSCSKGKNE